MWVVSVIIFATVMFESTNGVFTMASQASFGNEGEDLDWLCRRYFSIEQSSCPEFPSTRKQSCTLSIVYPTTSFLPKGLGMACPELHKSLFSLHAEVIAMHFHPLWIRIALLSRMSHNDMIRTLHGNIWLKNYAQPIICIYQSWKTFVCPSPLAPSGKWRGWTKELGRQR